MTPAEIAQKLKEISVEIGSRAEIFLNIDGRPYDEKWLRIGVYPDGLGKDCALSISATTWDEGFEALRVKWADRCADYRERRLTHTRQGTRDYERSKGREGNAMVRCSAWL